MIARLSGIALALAALLAPGIAAAQVVGTTPAAVAGGGGQRFVFAAAPFGAPVNGFLSPSASQLNETVDQWLPPLPAGGWVVFANYALSTASPADATLPTPREQYPGNANTIDYAVTFTGANGSGTRADCLFWDGKANATIASDGFAYLWVPPLPTGGWLRYSVTTPGGGKRVQGRNVSYPTIGNGLGDQRKWKAAFSSGEKAGGAIGGSTPFGRNGFGGVVQLLVPWTGQASVLLLADSIGQQDDDRDWFGSVAERGQIGYIPRGLDAGSGGQVGVGNFTSHTASTLDFTRSDPGYFAVRRAIVDFARVNLNGRRSWPFTAVWSELGRNDLTPTALGLAGTPGEADMLLAFKARMSAWWGALQAMFPGVPIVQNGITIKSTSSDGWTTLAGQGVRDTGASLDLANAWIMTRPAPLALAVDAMAAFRAPDDGSGIARIRLPALAAAGGAVVQTAVTTATVATTTGVTITAAAAPEIGAYLVLDPGTANAETLQVRAVTDNGGGSYTVFGIGNASGGGVNFAKAHAAGAAVSSAYTTDGVHPASAVHRLAAPAIIAAKASGVLSGASQPTP